MTPYLHARDLDPQAAMRLFCFPPAGSGTAAFYRWRRLLAPRLAIVPVHLPGREARLATPAHTHVAQAIQALTAALTPHLDRPYALFGHSMGALLAAILAPLLQPAPTLLIVSGREAPPLAAPHLAAPHLAATPQNFHRLPDQAFLDALASRYGEADGSLLQDPELRALFLPTLRADIALVESYVHVPSPKHSIPILALAGCDDASVTQPGLAAWAHFTSASCTIKRLPGGHFYHTGLSQPALLHLIEHALIEQSLLAQPPPPSLPPSR